MRVGRLLRLDALRTARDPLLLALALLPPALAVALRLGRDAALAALAVDDGATLALAVLLLTTPLMFGFAVALMLLDERDEGVLTAVSMTPAGKAGFLSFRVAGPVAWSALLTAIAVPLAGLTHVAPLRLLALVALCGVQAALMPAFLGAFAANKVEGIALSKVATVFIALGALGVLLPPAQQWLAWASPHYWLVRLLLAPPGGPLLASFGAGMFVHAAALALCIRRLRRRTG